MEEKELLTAAAAAAKLYVTRRTILKWAREDKIGCVRASPKVIYFTGEAIDIFLQSRAFDVESPNSNHKEAGRKIASPEINKGGSRHSSRKSWRSLKEVTSWQ